MRGNPVKLKLYKKIIVQPLHSLLTKTGQVRNIFKRLYLGVNIPSELAKRGGAKLPKPFGCATEQIE